MNSTLTITRRAGELVAGDGILVRRTLRRGRNGSYASSFRLSVPKSTRSAKRAVVAEVEVLAHGTVILHTDLGVLVLTSISDELTLAGAAVNA